MKKKGTAVICLFLMAVFMIGCTSQKAESSTSSSETGTQTEKQTEMQPETQTGSGNTASSLKADLTLAANANDVDIWAKIIQKFNTKYPGITIEVSPFDDYTALNQNVMAAHQAKGDYDIITVNHVDTLSYIKGDLLYPIGKMLKDKKVDIDSIIMGNLENMGKMGDMQYTIPINTDTRIMLINTDLFKKYNLPIPTTMDDMLKDGKIIHDANKGDYIFTDEMCTNGDYFSTYETGIFLQSFGGQLYKVDDTGKATATIDTKEMRDYLNFISQLIPYMPEDCTTNNDARSAFCEGNIGMYTFGPWEYSQMTLDELGFNYTLTKVPAGPAGSISTSGGFQIGIGSGTKNPDAAFAFIDFLITDPDSMAMIGSTGLPVTEAAFTTGQFAGEKYKVFKEQLNSSNLPQVPVANLGEVVASFSGYWNELCTGKITVDEMVPKAQADVQKLLDQDNK